MKPLLLVYNLPPERLARLRFLCMRLGLAVRPVPIEEWGTPLECLAGLAPYPAATEATAPTVPFTDPMLVMCGLNGSAVNALLAALRQAKFPPIALKAVLTPTNRTWNSIMLHAQLLEEHRAIQRGQSPVH